GGRQPAAAHAGADGGKAGQQDAHVAAGVAQGRGQGSVDVAQPARLEQRIEFGADIEDFHACPEAALVSKACSILRVTSTTPCSVRWKFRASSSASRPMRMPGGMRQPLSATTRYKSQLTPTSTCGSRTDSSIEE